MQSLRHFHTWLAIVLSITLPTQLFAHGSSVGELRIEHPYAMPGAAEAPQWMVYFRGIKNEGHTSDRLLKASTPVAAEVIFQRVMPAKSMLKTEVLGAIELPANLSTPMRHNLGEYRLLLKEMKQPIKDGDHFDLTLTFEHAGSETVKVYVQSAQTDAPAEHKLK